MGEASETAPSSLGDHEGDCSPPQGCPEKADAPVNLAKLSAADCTDTPRLDLKTGLHPDSNSGGQVAVPLDQPSYLAAKPRRRLPAHRVPPCPRTKLPASPRTSPRLRTVPMPRASTTRTSLTRTAAEETSRAPSRSSRTPLPSAPRHKLTGMATTMTTRGEPGVQYAARRGGPRPCIHCKRPSHVGGRYGECDSCAQRRRRGTRSARLWALRKCNRCSSDLGDNHEFVMCLRCRISARESKKRLLEEKKGRDKRRGSGGGEKTE